MRLDDKSALVLEGGGMRGVFTCGVLDYLMDNKIRFPYSVGVSAGACNGLSYMSHQRGRGKYSNIDLLAKYKYMGIRPFLKGRGLIDQKLLFHRFPDRILPYNYKAYAENPNRFEMVTTDCLSGRPCYWEEKVDERRIIDIVKASSSLPYACPIVYVDGKPMLDGGIVDSIPLQRAYDQGYENCVVVLTRNRGYRKSDREVIVPHFIYKEYPRLRVALRNRNKVYNEQLEMVERLEDEGKIKVIRPLKPIVVDRMETNVRKLTDLYEEGYDCARKMFEGID
ncbi:MAG: patatin family protein [Bacteroidaceae bacterium]|nr:patatin family protein [Bacteroidaceae bacterium]